MSAVALALLDRGPPPLDDLRRTVRAGAPKQPGVYVFRDTADRVIYVGKARNLRTRLLSYFSAPWPESKSARLIRCAADIQWRPLPSEFAALLEEQRLIRSMRPAYNVRGAVTRARLVFLKLTGGPAPRIALTESARDAGALYYGPFRGRATTAEAVHTLNDLLGLRDCAQAMPMSFADQATLFDAPQSARCIRHELGSCLGPCAALCAADQYGAAVQAAADFLEGRSAEPIGRVLDVMAESAEANAFERAAAWKRKFEALEWFFGAIARLRAAIDGLSFVYEVGDRAGGHDDRVYLIRHGVVRAEAPRPVSPLERSAFAAAVQRHAVDTGPAPAARSAEEMNQVLLVMSWFRQFPEEYDHIAPLSRWDAVPA